MQSALPSNLNERYRLVEKIGEGGMAEVYRAEDTLLERVVAIKLLREQHLADPEFVSRFQQEARSAAKVAHPNIVSVYDVGSVGRANFIVMELVEGENLKSLIKREGPLGVARAVEISAQILAALGFAHQKGLVHRDVKPQNILVGADGLVKVADFGIARAANAPQHTATGVVLGTAQYCSPEQAMGKAASVESDIYSAGVVLYEMLTGELPFEAETPLAVALMHLQEPPRPPRDLNPAIPPRLEQIVLKALAKTPEERFASAAEMRQALQNYRRFGQEETSVFQAVPTQGAAASAAAASTSATATRTAATGAALRSGRDPRYAARRSVAAPKRGVDWLAVALGVFVFVAVAGAVPLALRVYALYFNQPAPAATAGSTSVPATTTTAAPQPTAPAVALPTSTPALTQTVSPTPTQASLVPAPKLVGLAYDQALKLASDQGFNAVLVGEDYSTLPEMTVLSQSPAPDSKVPANSAIDVTVSRGPEKAVVDPVVGNTLADARSKLVAAGFSVNSTESWSAQVPAGAVISQQPNGGELLAKGGVVQLVVSKGPQAPTPTPQTVRPPEGDWAWVPDVVKLPEAVARQRIEQAGLQTSYTNYQTAADVPASQADFFNSVAPGAVLSISPQVGQRVPKGSVVQIAVRKP